MGIVRVEEVVYFFELFGNLPAVSRGKSDAHLEARTDSRMKRWFYILLGGLGMGLALASLFLLWQSQFIPPAYQVRVQVCEFISVPLGLLLGYLGFVNGRRAGEFDIGGIRQIQPQARLSRERNRDRICLSGVSQGVSRQPAAGGQAIYLP